MSLLALLLAQAAPASVPPSNASALLTLEQVERGEIPWPPPPPPPWGGGGGMSRMAGSNPVVELKKRDIRVDGHMRWSCKLKSASDKERVVSGRLILRTVTVGNAIDQYFDMIFEDTGGLGFVGEQYGKRNGGVPSSMFFQWAKWLRGAPRFGVSLVFADDGRGWDGMRLNVMTVAVREGRDAFPDDWVGMGYCGSTVLPVEDVK